jgi:hypothetical protein
MQLIGVKLLLSESVGEDVSSLFRGRTKMQVDDPLMDYISDVVHIDLDILFLFILHRVSIKLESTLVVPPNDIRSMELDAQLGKDVL